MGFIYLFRAAWLYACGRRVVCASAPGPASGLVALVMLLDLGRLAVARVAMLNPLIY